MFANNHPSSTTANRCTSHITLEGELLSDVANQMTSDNRAYFRVVVYFGPANSLMIINELLVAVLLPDVLILGSSHVPLRRSS